ISNARKSDSCAGASVLGITLLHMAISVGVREILSSTRTAVWTPRQLVFRTKPRDVAGDEYVCALDSGKIGHIVEPFTGADQLGPTKRTMAGKRATPGRSGRTISTGRSSPAASPCSLEHLRDTLDAEP